ncbi:MAG: YegS/Rv2252/BmrU family lipid kinase [Actinomycetota bacterium]|nr:YegS/Rv2252/BmrU family lipid kinase [Actinomycetota bacterium]
MTSQGSAGEIGLVVNAAAGKGTGQRAARLSAERLRAAGFAVREITGRTAAESLATARAAVGDGLSGLVAVGGDGTVHLALQAVAGTTTPLGVVPAGTGNDFATALGLSPRRPSDAVAAVVAGRTRSVDAVRVGDLWWDCVMGAGFDSAVNERANGMRWPRGPMRYNLAILAELGVFRPAPFTLALDGVRSETEAMLVAVANAPAYGGGLRVAPEALLDDGLLDVVVVGPMSKATFLRLLPQVRSGGHIGHPSVTVHRARVVELAGEGQTAYADGELLSPLPVRAECVPGALQVFAPGAAT